MVFSYFLQIAECNELLLLYIGTLEYSYYVFTIHFYKLNGVPSSPKVTGVDFYVSICLMDLYVEREEYRTGSVPCDRKVGEGVPKADLRAH